MDCKSNDLFPYKRRKGHRDIKTQRHKDKGHEKTEWRLEQYSNRGRSAKDTESPQHLGKGREEFF